MRIARFLLVVAVAMVLTPSFASAEEETKKKKEFSDTIIVIQRKPFLRKGRVELAPMFFTSVNDSLSLQLSAGATVNYHINEWLYAGVTGGWQDWRWMNPDSNGFSDDYRQMIDATDAIPEVSVLNGMVGGIVGFIPAYGKLALFNSAIIHWDLFAGVGGELIHTRTNSMTGGGLAFVGQRYFLLDWLSLNLEIKGHFYFDELNQISGLFTLWQAGIGVAFWLPPSFEYESD